MFEKVIKRISATVAGCIVFVLVSGMYLSAKGFQVDDNGNFVLMNQASAKDVEEQVKEIPLNFGFPQEHVLGDENAKVTLYEYSSFGCTHCADFHLETLPTIVKDYVDTGMIKVAFVPFPLDKNSGILARVLCWNNCFELSAITVPIFSNVKNPFFPLSEVLLSNFENQACISFAVCADFELERSPVAIPATAL